METSRMVTIDLVVQPRFVVVGLCCRAKKLRNPPPRTPVGPGLACHRHASHRRACYRRASQRHTSLTSMRLSQPRISHITVRSPLWLSYSGEKGCCMKRGVCKGVVPSQSARASIAEQPGKFSTDTHCPLLRMCSLELTYPGRGRSNM